MGLDFRARDFLYPLSIFKLASSFKNNQWLAPEELRDYQLKRLRIILEHAHKNVPYYRNLFKNNGIIPSDIKTTGDLSIIPPLTRDILRNNFQQLLADNFKKYKPTLQHTSGTTADQIKFYTDKTSNVLEFVYYWRFWGWAGYRLGDIFAELSAQFFTPYEEKKNLFCHFEHNTRRLLVNSLLISRKNYTEYEKIFKKHKPLFLKGLPSNLYMLALVFNGQNNHGISFKAIFSQGENLLKYQRDMIEKTFSCKVFDSYGHMERTMVISQCPLGAYHVHADYGVAEFIKLKESNFVTLDSSSYVAEIFGTSLHNFAMPLIRYQTRDYARVPVVQEICPCKRSLPTVISLEGRSIDVVITPDNRAVTALYVAFDRTPGILFGQIIQESLNKLVVRVVPEPGVELDKALIKNLRDFVGDKMGIEIIHEPMEKIKGEGTEKFKVIISKVSQQLN